MRELWILRRSDGVALKWMLQRTDAETGTKIILRIGDDEPPVDLKNNAEILIREVAR